MKNKIYLAIKAFKTIRHQASKENSISASLVRSIYYDKNGYLWVGTIDNGINVLKNGEKVAHFVHNENDPYSLSNNAVTGIMENEDGDYWISTGGNGVCVLKNFKYDKPTNAKFIRYQHDPLDFNTISSNNVTGIYEDSGGHNVDWNLVWLVQI